MRKHHLAIAFICAVAVSTFAAKSPAPKDQSDVGSHVNKGVALAQQKQYDAAIAEFNAAIQANPKNVRAYVNRGTAYRAQQKYDLAMADFAKAIELAPNDESGYFERGQTLVMQKQYSDALPDLNKAAELKADDANAIRMRGFAEIGLTDWDKAIADFTAAKVVPRWHIRSYRFPAVRGDAVETWGRRNRGIERN